MPRPATRIRPPATDFEEPVYIHFDSIPREVHRSREAVRKWVSRGLITPVMGGKLFDLSEVTRVAHETQHRAATRRACDQQRLAMSS